MPIRAAAGVSRLPAFAGIWTELKGDYGTQPIPGPDLVYGFLTTAQNFRLAIEVTGMGIRTSASISTYYPTSYNTRGL